MRNRSPKEKGVTMKLSQHVKSAFVMVILTFIWGCGGGGGSTSNDAVNKVASFSVTPSSNGEYVIQGNNLVGVAGIELTVSYDSLTLSSPNVTTGALASDALMAPNTNIPGSIRIAIATTKDISGNGQIVKISFASATGPGTVAIVSAKTINLNGDQLPITF
jgi:hypothetical protein